MFLRRRKLVRALLTLLDVSAKPATLTRLPTCYRDSDSVHRGSLQLEQIEVENTSTPIVVLSCFPMDGSSITVPENSSSAST